MNFEPIIQQFRRVQITFLHQPFEMLIELLVITILVYLVMRFLRGTRGWS